MDAKRLLITPFLAGVVAAAVLFGAQAQVASAEVPAPHVSPYLRAAIKADVEARGYKYAGDFRFDAMYAAPGDWVSSVQSVGPNGAVVTYGKYASDEIITVKFVSNGGYGWVNPDTGVGSPQRVPVMSAQPSTTLRTWIVHGMDFAPNTEVALFDGSPCGGELRCPTDHKLVTVTTDATGAFKATVTFGDYPLQPGQVHRLIQASGGAFFQVRIDQESPSQPTPTNPTPTNPSPTNPAPTNPAPTNPAPTNPPSSPTSPANPTPQVPSTGDDNDGGSDNEAIAWGLGAVALIALGGLGVVAVNRRK